LTPKAKVNDGLIERVSYFVAWALVGYLYFRFWDALAQHYTYQPGRSEGLELMTSGALSFNFWISEMLLGTVVPMILLLNPPTRKHPFWRMVALGLVVIGVIAYRWDTNISGLLVVVSYLPGQPTVEYASYHPSLIEYVTGLGVIAYGLLAFSLGVRYLRVVDHRYAQEEHETVKVKTVGTVPA
jgi:molybdopterin-containing oxidoreductase family membrane subunit